MLSFELASKIGVKPSAKEEWQKWIIAEYAMHLGSFASFTFSKPTNRNVALAKGKRFGRLLNESIYGRYYRRRGEGLISIFSVEGNAEIVSKLTNPHLHYLIEKHPLVTPSRIADLWAKIAGRKAANIGVKVEPIRTIKEATEYILKEITWENGPQLYVPYDPKSSLEAVREQ